MIVRHTGGAELSVRLEEGRIRGVSTKSRGMITAVNLQRGPTFASPSETG